MAEPRRGLRFPLKSAQRLAVAKQAAGQDFYCDLAMQAEVGRFVNGTHPAMAYQAVQPIPIFNSPLHRQRQRQFTPILTAELYAVVKTGPARRTLSEQVKVLVFDPCQYLAPDLLLVRDTLFELDILPDDGDLTGNGL
jgi:hypothetical protein